MDAVGVEIHALKRVAFGPLGIRNLPRGSWRRLEAAEIAELESLNRNG
jgi:16S rRNA U516 pseudouridylate synthase RsuA-like enzyme